MDASEIRKALDEAVYQAGDSMETLIGWTVCYVLDAHVTKAHALGNPNPNIATMFDVILDKVLDMVNSMPALRVRYMTELARS